MRPAFVCSKCNDPDFLNQCCGSKYLSYFHPSGYTPMNITISNITLILCVPANTKIGLNHWSPFVLQSQVRLARSLEVQYLYFCHGVETCYLGTLILNDVSVQNIHVWGRKVYSLVSDQLLYKYNLDLMFPWLSRLAIGPHLHILVWEHGLGSFFPKINAHTPSSNNTSTTKKKKNYRIQ